MKNILVAPSILSADFMQLGRDIEMLNRSGADWIHVDVMDGVFVPNITFGMPVISQLSQIARKPLDVHLMITQPDRYIEDFKRCGAEWLTVHYEACTHLHRTIQCIRAAGMKAGVALNPHTPVSVLENIIEDVDMVLIMSVNPGFGGQSFIESSLRKIAKLRKMIEESGSHALIEVDGGVNLHTGRKLVDAGVDVLVAGSFVFKATFPEEAVIALKKLGE